MRRKPVAFLCLFTALGGFIAVRQPEGRVGSVRQKEAAARIPGEPAPAGLESPAVLLQAGVAAAVDAGAERLLALRQDIRWRQPVVEPAFAAFREWTTGFAAGIRSEEEGVALAVIRQAALLDLIDQNPRRALELAVPETVRRALPPAVQALLEERISGRGNLLVAAAVAMPGHEHKVRPVTRTVEMDGRTFDTYTYGNREPAMSRAGLAVHGIALGGKLALSEWPARVLEPVEVREARAVLTAPPVCPVSRMPMDENGDEVVLDFSLEKALWFCQAGHAMKELEAAAAMEAALPPGVAAAGIGGGADLPAPQEGWTEGIKKLLLIRVDFPDKPGQVVSDGTLTALADSFADHWLVMSYGKTAWCKTGAGSTVTPTLRLPKSHTQYTGLAAMLAAARAAAGDAGFDYRNYDCDMVVTGDKPDVSFGGIAYVGERGAWLANGSWNLGVCSHEAGHNFGLNHAGFWDTAGGPVTGPGTSVEYGNPFDHMGRAASSTAAHFGARQKNYLGWIPDDSVTRITADGTFTQRISAMDHRDAAGVRAIAVDRAGTAQDYWIEYRTAYSSNPWMQDGIVVNFGELSRSNAKPSLLDFTPGTGSREDCPLLTGRTFSDAAGAVHITPGERGTGPGGVPWMEVTVSRGDFPGNRRPAAAISYSPAAPALNAEVSFRVDAADPDGDSLAYSWDWGDGSGTVNNRPAAVHSWSTGGLKTVRCTVSDRKGLAVTARVLVQAGPGTGFFVSGSVRTAGGLPVEGAVVSAGGRSDTTDSEGFYAVTGLPAGSYTVTALKTGCVFSEDGFTGPVAVGPGKTGINFLVPAGSPAFAGMKPALVNAGSGTGAVPLDLTDSDTPVTALTLTAVSSHPALIPDDAIAFGAGDPRTVAVTAPSGGSGTAEITITAADPEGHTSRFVWPVTVNGAPQHVPALLTALENTPLDIDLRTLVRDDRTPDDGIAFQVDRVRGGSLHLLPGGHTARFTPLPDYDGAASFRLTSHDQSLSSRTLLLYTFEPDAQSGGGISSGKASDLSNFNRTGTIEAAGNGEYAGVTDVPPVLAPFSTTALSLTENGPGAAARLLRAFTAADLDWNHADWTFCAWVKRASTGTGDFVFHLGDGNGLGDVDELGLYWPAGGDELRLEKRNAEGSQAVIRHAPVPAGEWHYVSITCDRTAPNTATLTLYVDGFPAGSMEGVTMAVNQVRPVVIGGHAESSGDFAGWLDGRLDDVLISGGVLSRAELRQLTTMGAAHVFGLPVADSFDVTVNGLNHAPSVSMIPDAGLNAGTVSAPLPFSVSDAESEHHTLTVTGASSNPALLPRTGITVSGPPAAWSSEDTGAAGAPGSTVEDHGVFLIGAPAGDPAGDAFRFVSKEMSGDGAIVCRVRSVDGVHPESHAGLMIRDGNAGEAAFAGVSVSAGGGVRFQGRTAAAAGAAEGPPVERIAAPVWLKLERRGQTITGHYAADAEGVPGAWQTAGAATGFTLPAQVRAGMAVTASGDGSPAAAVIDHVSGNIQNGGERTVTLAPAPGQTGTATVTLTVSDGTAAASRSFLAVVGVNTPPFINAVTGLTVTGGQVPAPFSVSLGDLHTPAAGLMLSAASSNATLLPRNHIIFSGTGAVRSVQLRPVPGESGTTEITLTVSDGAASASRTFTLAVLPGDPAVLVSAGTNWRYLDTGISPAGWQNPGFSDSAWPVGPAQLGFGDGDESTFLAPNAARKTTYFRRSFQLADVSAWRDLKLRVLRDDGAVIWLNGQEIWRTNMPQGPVTAATDAAAAVTGAEEAEFSEFTVRRPPFAAGTNILAAEIHQRGSNSGDLSFDLEATGLNPAPLQVIAAGSAWRYLDDGSDPGPEWTAETFADTAWKSGPAQLGYGDGDEATVMDGGSGISPRVTSWFRQKFTVADRSAISGIGLRVLRDDGILVWLNGRPLYRNNLPAEGLSAATPATSPVAAADESVWQTVFVPPDALVDGVNQVAVELHQAGMDGGDASFDLHMQLYPWDSLPPLAAVPDGNTVTLAWPLWARGWSLQSSANLTEWTTETAVPAAGEGGCRVTLERTAARKYFRLAFL